MWRDLEADVAREFENRSVPVLLDLCVMPTGSHVGIKKGKQTKREKREARARIGAREWQDTLNDPIKHEAEKKRKRDMRALRNVDQFIAQKMRMICHGRELSEAEARRICLHPDGRFESECFGDFVWWLRVSKNIAPARIASMLDSELDVIKAYLSSRKQSG